MGDGDRRLAPDERRELILAEVVAGRGQVGELAVALNGSPATIRRDLQRLTHASLAWRTYGGAVGNLHPLEDGRTRGVGCAGLVVGGGQTASSVMDVLGATHLVAGPEVAPLCPRATVTGGAWAGLPVVTKGGLVGGPGTLSHIVSTLWKECA